MPKKMKKMEAQTAPTAIENDGKYDHETLMRAEEIRMDPKRLKAAMGHHKKMKKAIKSLSDLSKARYPEGDEESEMEE